MKKKASIQGGSERKFIHDMGINGIRIIQSESRLNMRGGQLPPTSTINIGCKIGGNPDEKTLLVNAICEVVSFYEDDASNPAFKIRCEYQVVYSFAENKFPTAEDVKLHQAELQTTAMIQLWPFMRHHVYWISSQMQIPPITIPPYNFSFDMQTKTPEGAPPVDTQKRRKKSVTK